MCVCVCAVRRRSAGRGRGHQQPTIHGGASGAPAAHDGKEGLLRPADSSAGHSYAGFGSHAPTDSATRPWVDGAAAAAAAGGRREEDEATSGARATPALALSLFLSPRAHTPRPPARCTRAESLRGTRSPQRSRPTSCGRTGGEEGPASRRSDLSTLANSHTFAFPLLT